MLLIEAGGAQDYPEYDFRPLPRAVSRLREREAVRVVGQAYRPVERPLEGAVAGVVPVVLRREVYERHVGRLTDTRMMVFRKCAA